MSAVDGRIGRYWNDDAFTILSFLELCSYKAEKVDLTYVSVVTVHIHRKYDTVVTTDFYFTEKRLEPCEGSIYLA